MAVLAARLRADLGVRLTLLDRSPLTADSGVRVVQADVRDRETLREALSEGFDVVVHGAALTHVPSWERTRPADYVDVNVMGTSAVLDAVLASAQPPRPVRRAAADRRGPRGARARAGRPPGRRRPGARSRSGRAPRQGRGERRLPGPADAVLAAPALPGAGVVLLRLGVAQPRDVPAREHASPAVTAGRPKPDQSRIRASRARRR
ncbi:NAD(P)-dependent oxidoreductase [Microbispora tritici]|uniref:NAD(P)-dependent oxidoreductase n=1 Tax=Microbispora tritici TaxID=2604471 RepID=A0ABY3LRX5_9ACTN|nr:NAD(P)-dependent oxidoreductase [Microbispora tritici]